MLGIQDSGGSRASAFKLWGDVWLHCLRGLPDEHRGRLKWNVETQKVLRYPRRAAVEGLGFVGFRGV